MVHAHVKHSTAATQLDLHPHDLLMEPCGGQLRNHRLLLRSLLQTKRGRDGKSCLKSLMLLPSPQDFSFLTDGIPQHPNVTKTHQKSPELLVKTAFRPQALADSSRKTPTELFRTDLQGVFW